MNKTDVVHFNYIAVDNHFSVVFEQLYIAIESPHLHIISCFIPYVFEIVFELTCNRIYYYHMYNPEMVTYKSRHDRNVRLFHIHGVLRE